MTTDRVDPFQRDEIVEWLTANGFKDYEGHGYWQHVYGLSHDRITLSVGIPDGQICATLTVERGNVDERMRIMIGEAYTVGPIAALWGVLQLFDFSESRNAMYWRDFHERRYPSPAPIPEHHQRAAERFRRFFKPVPLTETEQLPDPDYGLDTPAASPGAPRTAPPEEQA